MAKAVKLKTKQAKKKTGREVKVQAVAALTDKVGKAKTMIFTNYRGLTHKQIETIKKKVKTLDAEYVITKNTLLKRSLESKNLKLEDEKALDQQTATLFAYADIVEPLKAIAKTMKELNLPTVKFGFMDGQLISGEQVLKLATLPSREVLLAQFVGGLKSPIYGLHRALNWNLQKFVMTLKAIESKKV